MGLILPKAPSFVYCTNTVTGTPSATSHGVAVTAGANNADGTSVALLTNIAHDVEYLVLGFNGFTTSTANCSVLADILIDPAGGTSWSATPLINDLLAGFCQGVTGAINGNRMYYFPLFIKAGTSIGCRARCAHTATIAGRVFAAAFGGNENPGAWWCGKSITTIGADAANSRGQMHTPGNTGAFSAWTNLGSTLPAPAGAFQWAVQGPGSATITSLQFHFEFGIGSTRIGMPIHHQTSSGSFCACQPTFGPLFYEAPSGAQLQVRGTCVSTGVAQDVAAYAVH